MPKNHDSFDDALLSGYLDGELTQAESQRVEIYLEDHPDARKGLEEMAALRDAAASTAFKAPNDDQWNEQPWSTGSRVARHLGWAIVLVWVAVVAGFSLWQLATSPGHLTEKVLVFGALSGFGLLLTSVLLDRLKAAQTDRYKRVEK